MPPQGQADPFAQYATQDGNDPFAQYATDQPASAKGREPTTYLQDVGNFALEELKGGGEALLGAVDPRTYYNLGKDVLTNRGRNTLAGFKETGKQVLAGNPRAIGNVLGGVVAGKALPAMAKAAPDAMVTAGGALERGGAAVAKSGPGRWAAGGAVLSGNPKAMAIAASPYAAQGAGKILAKGGRILGGGKPAPTKWLPTPEYGPPDTSVAEPTWHSEAVPDTVPEPTGNPSFAAVGDEAEAAFNASRQSSPNVGAMSPDDIAHQTLLDKLGGTGGTGTTSPDLIEPAPLVPRDIEPSMADIATQDARDSWGHKNTNIPAQESLDRTVGPQPRSFPDTRGQEIINKMEGMSREQALAYRAAAKPGPVMVVLDNFLRQKGWIQ